MVKNNKSGQAAMEFLMTYSWAILIVLGAIAGLAYFGVFNMDNLKPSTCIIPGGISCIDHTYIDGRFTMVIQNAIGQAVTINRIEATGCDTYFDMSTNKLKNGDTRTYTLLNCDNFGGDLRVFYEKEGLLRSTTGSSSTKTVGATTLPPPPTSPITFETYCSNAHSANLCDVLGTEVIFTDIPNYCDLCCTEWALCCGRC